MTPILSSTPWYTKLSYQKEVLGSTLQMWYVNPGRLRWLHKKCDEGYRSQLSSQLWGQMGIHSWGAATNEENNQAMETTDCLDWWIQNLGSPQGHERLPSGSKARGYLRNLHLPGGFLIHCKNGMSYWQQFAHEYKRLLTNMGLKFPLMSKWPMK